MNLYLETYSGIAGDMTIGALLDLGADREILLKALKSMDFGDYELVFERCKKKGIDAFNFDVKLKHEQYHHHHKHDEEIEHTHDIERHTHEHTHGDITHTHTHHHHEHHHRGLSEIIKIIDSGDISEKAKENAKNMFKIIGEAESKAHGVDIEQVHFHEVGAIDSIIDIVGTAVLIDSLNPEHIYSTEIYEGYGFVKCAHGTMPVPAPAVLNIIKNEELHLNLIDDLGEHVTPTGAAIIANYSEGKVPYAFKINKIGLGAGNREFKNSIGILRIMEIEK